MSLVQIRSPGIGPLVGAVVHDKGMTVYNTLVARSFRGMGIKKRFFCRSTLERVRYTYTMLLIFVSSKKKPHVAKAMFYRETMDKKNKKTCRVIFIYLQTAANPGMLRMGHVSRKTQKGIPSLRGGSVIWRRKPRESE